MSYIVSGLDPSPFRHLYGSSDAALRAIGVHRRVVDVEGEYPDRIELRDAPVGSCVLLVNHTHQPAATPYRSCHAVFLREGATEAAVVRGGVPDSLSRRQISLRGFDQHDMLAAAGVVDGRDLEPLILEFLTRPEIAYLQAHYAAAGCYAASIRRG